MKKLNIAIGNLLSDSTDMHAESMDTFHCGFDEHVKLTTGLTNATENTKHLFYD